MISQAQRFAFVTCPLGENTLLFHQMTGHEEMGRLFEYEIELLSEQQHIDINKVLGQPMTLTLELPKKNKRDYHGYVTQFRQHGTLGELFKYRAVLRPWLWFLTRHSHCRIFQELSIPDILNQVFQSHGFSDVELNLSQSYPVREYCVQYRETDFNFVSRLMEQEGMYYFFTHQHNKHTLVIADSVNTYQLIPDYDKIEFFPEENVEQREVEHIFQWDTHHEMQAGSYTLNDFDFKKPQADLFTKFAAQKSHHYADGEYYDYPGNYTEVNVGETYATTRLDELHSQHEIIYGRGNARGISCGMQFALKNHYRTSANTQYVVVAADFFIRSNAYGSQQSGDFSGYECGFQAMPATQTFRPRRITPVPFVQGPQTAVVVGKEGEEIWTDKYGRVKVQFHWDRDGKKNEASSCWIRVATPVAGKQWGWVSLPRIGQEVVVSFLEGNPDRPLITGSVYNANQMPPYALPANQTQSGIKTRSSKSGTPENFNELRFEDKKGQEQVYLHAEKNLDTVVENNETRKIGLSKKDTGNQTIEIHNNRDVTLNKGNDTLSIKNGFKLVDIQKGDYVVNIGSSKCHDIAYIVNKIANEMANEIINKIESEISPSLPSTDELISTASKKLFGVDISTFNFCHTDGQPSSIKGDYKLNIGFGSYISNIFEGNYTTKIIKGSYEANIGYGDYSLNILKGGCSTNIGFGNYELNINKGERTVNVNKDNVLNVKKGDDVVNVEKGNYVVKISSGKATVEAMESIELKVGNNSITIDQKGIKIKGVIIKIEADSLFRAKAKITKLSGEGTMIIDGSLVKIN